MLLISWNFAVAFHIYSAICTLLQNNYMLSSRQAVDTAAYLFKKIVARFLAAQIVSWPLLDALFSVPRDGRWVRISGGVIKM